MRWTLAAAAAAVIMLGLSARAKARPMLHDAVALNIGVNCQWQSSCMGRQRSAMKQALVYVAKSRPPQWRVQLCNRNAGRGGYRVDWVGFEHCIRNASLREPPRRKKSTRR
jgi:hypothetical protein